LAWKNVPRDPDCAATTSVHTRTEKVREPSGVVCVVSASTMSRYSAVCLSLGIATGIDTQDFDAHEHESLAGLSICRSGPY
jgi:hypothetical protein